MIDKDIEIFQEKMIKILSGDKGLKQLEFDFSARVNEAKKDGATCQSCLQHYPYAEGAANFKCWSCRNF